MVPLMNDTIPADAILFQGSIKLSKYSASRWSYTIYNGKGGSFTSTSYKSQKAALAAATQNLPLYTKVAIRIEKWDPETSDYVCTKCIYYFKGV